MSPSSRSILAALLALGCTGTGLKVSGGTGGKGGSPAGTGGSGPPPDAGVPRDTGQAEASEPELPPFGDHASVPGPAPLRRLTVEEYNNTVRDLLGGNPAFSSTRLGVDRPAWWPSGFVHGASISTGDDARGLMANAEELGAGMTARLPMLLPCAATAATPAQEDACLDQFISDFGLRAFRRPLAATERERLRALYRTLRGPDAADSFAEAIVDLAAAMLQSPEFLYRRELGPGTIVRDGTLIRFNEFELASRLSYLLWASMPDQALFEAAKNARLHSATQLVAQARRLLADGRARDGMHAFHRQWLELDDLESNLKDAAAFKDFTPALARSMLAESREFVASVYLGQQPTRTLEALLEGTDSFVDPPLARFYGVAEPGGTGLQRVSLPANQRAGIFTRAAFLASKADASDSNPVDRGTTVLRRLLCVDLVEPDNLVIPPPPEPKPGQTTRERFEAHGMVACASACHQGIVDPLGYAFENYDATGAWRDTENGKPINARATAPIDGQPREFKDAIELMNILARSSQVRDCMTSQWVRYLLGRHDLPDESPSVKVLSQHFRASGDDLRELVVALVRTRTFTHRTLSPGETP
jgi:hypothetical protein